MKIPKLPDRIKYPVDNPNVDDAALDYVENEIGRFHLVDNWKQAKEDKNLPKNIQRWLNYFEYENVTPQEIIDFIDKFIDKVHRGQIYL